MVERLGARDGDGERGCVLLQRLDLFDERIRLVVVEERDGNHRRMAVLRDQRAAGVLEVGASRVERRDLGIVDEVAHE